MNIEVKAGERLVKLELVKKEGNKATVLLDGKEFNIDLIEVSEGIYSMIHEGISYNVQIAEPVSPKKYLVNTFLTAFEIEIIDEESRYQMSRNKGGLEDGGAVIASPMPGKVVKILVAEGDSVTEGTTVVVVEAMKMQSEYKVKKDRIIKKVCIKEGDTVDANQPLIIVE